jgi:phosphatidylglycerophosphatase A
MNFIEKTVLFLGTGGYIGYIPVMPGTFGSGLGLFCCFLLSLVPLTVSAVATVAFILIAVWVSQESEKLLNQKDPGCIVIDEIAGMMVMFLGIPFNMMTMVVGFLLFRLLDIVKPPPIRTIQNKLEGGAGVVMDDVAAGVAGNIVLQLIFI